MRNTNTFCFVVKLDGLGMTAVINSSSADQRKTLMRAVGDLSKLLQSPGVSIDISKGDEEEPTSGDLH